MRALSKNILPLPWRSGPSARAERTHLLRVVNAFIVKSLTSCVAFGLGSP
jgi:hypothetical protein